MALRRSNAFVMDDDETSSSEWEMLDSPSPRPSRLRTRSRSRSRHFRHVESGRANDQIHRLNVGTSNNEFHGPCHQRLPLSITVNGGHAGGRQLITINPSHQTRIGIDVVIVTSGTGVDGNASESHRHISHSHSPSSSPSVANPVAPAWALTSTPCSTLQHQMTMTRATRVTGVTRGGRDGSAA